jgi:molecular chaperone DnaJ
LLKIASGTEPGEIIRLKGRGLPDLRSRRRGDLFVKVSVQTPDNLTREEKALLRQFAELRGENPDQVDRSILSRIKSRFHERAH